MEDSLQVLCAFEVTVGTFLSGNALARQRREKSIHILGPRDPKR